MKILKYLFLFGLIVGCSNPNKRKVKNNFRIETDSIKITTISEPLDNDTIIVDKMKDCIPFYSKYSFYPEEYINNLNLLELKTPYHQLQYFGETNRQNFFIVYSYTIELEIGWINLIVCDSIGKTLYRYNMSQIYENIKVEKKDGDLYRIYGENPDEVYGPSANIKNTGLDNNYDFDFYVTIHPSDSIIIGYNSNTP